MRKVSLQIVIKYKSGRLEHSYYFFQSSIIFFKSMINYYKFLSLHWTNFFKDTLPGVTGPFHWYIWLSYIKFLAGCYAQVFVLMESRKRTFATCYRVYVTRLGTSSLKSPVVVITLVLLILHSRDVALR